MEEEKKPRSERKSSLKLFQQYAKERAKNPHASRRELLIKLGGNPKAYPRWMDTKELETQVEIEKLRAWKDGSLNTAKAADMILDLISDEIITRLRSDKLRPQIPFKSLADYHSKLLRLKADLTSSIPPQLQSAESAMAELNANLAEPEEEEKVQEPTAQKEEKEEPEEVLADDAEQERIDAVLRGEDADAEDLSGVQTVAS